MMRCFLDVIFLKKQHKTNMTQIRTFFLRFALNINLTDAINLFNKTLKTNFILMMHYDRTIMNWGFQIVDITNCLKPSFLSDYHLWFHLKNLGTQ